MNRGWVLLGAWAIGAWLAACSGASSDSEPGSAGRSSAGSAGDTAQAGTNQSSSGMGGSPASAGQGPIAGMPSLTPTTPAEACVEYARARCERFQSCLGAQFSGDFADVAACEAVTRGYCESDFGAMGSSRTLSNMASCTAGVSAQSCRDWVLARPADCRLPGALPLAAACEFDTQCTTGYCHVARGSNSFCGVCAARLKAGAACSGTSEACEVNLRCFDQCPSSAPCAEAEKKSICGPPKESGEACRAMYGECRPDLLCRAGVCVAGKKEGEACATPVDCASSSPLTCRAGVCTKYHTVPVGAPCDWSKLESCTDGAVCRDAAGTRASVGTCVRAPVAGESCLASDCRAPAVCQNDVCVAPAIPSACR